MKQPVTPMAQNAQEQDTRSYPGSKAGPSNGYLAQLSSAVNQSPLVQSQLRLRDDMAQGFWQRDVRSMPVQPLPARAASTSPLMPVAQLALDLTFWPVIW